MSAHALSLTISQEAAAHDYWHRLLFPVSARELHAARRGLKYEDLAIIDAVMNALAVVWDRDCAPLPEENPFTAKED